MLLEEFLEPMGLSAQDLAARIHIARESIDGLIQGQASMTPSLALRLAKFFNMSPEFWLNLQVRSDLYYTQQEEAKTLDQIQPYRVVA
jgi:addiction module HigA family antidote